MRNATHLVLVGLTLVAAAACKKDKDSGETLNHSPQADAGADQLADAGEEVALDGRGSYDPDGDGLTYHWSLDHAPQGSTLPTAEAAFSSNHDNTGTTSIRPDATGAYVVKLEVEDGTLYSTPDYLLLNVGESDSVPTANAGADQLLDIGGTVTFDGGKSFDPLGGDLVYHWTLVEKPYNSSLSDGDLTGIDAATVSFDPDVIGSYTVTLTVVNPLESADYDSARVTVQGPNDAPSVFAGSDQNGEDCTSIALTCEGSDPNNDALTYYWELQSKPAASAASNYSFGDRSEGETTFFADVAGVYSMSCSAFDGRAWSAPDIVYLNLAERATNTPPIADAGENITIDAGDAECVEEGYGYDCDDCPVQTANLGADGEASDADGDPFELVWTIKSGKATLQDTDVIPVKAVLSKTSPDEPADCTDTPFTFTMTVTDCPGAISTDDVIVTVECCGIEG